MKFTKATPLKRGTSGARTLFAEDDTGKHFFVKVIPAKEDGNKDAAAAYEFKIMRTLYENGIPTPKPICNLHDEGRIFFVYEWIEGINLDTVLKKLPKPKRYTCGLETGKLLRKIHSTPIEIKGPIFSSTFKDMRNSVLEPENLEIISNYQGADRLINYLEKHSDIEIEGNVETAYHGDFGPFNILFADEKLYVIDAKYYGRGVDPMWDMYNTCIFGVVHPEYYNGWYHGYFGRNPSAEAWQKLTYFGVLRLFSKTIKENTPEYQKAFNAFNYSFDNMKKTVPKWYRRK